MLDESAEPRDLRGAHLTSLAREDLELYGVLELEERIAQLRAEIERTAAQLARKRAGREAADAFFKLNKD